MIRIGNCKTPRSTAEAVAIAYLLLNRRGYIVLSTLRMSQPYRIGQTVTELWTFVQEQPFAITRETDARDWNQQIRFLSANRPEQWREVQREEEDCRFWRAVTD